MHPDSLINLKVDANMVKKSLGKILIGFDAIRAYLAKPDGAPMSRPTLQKFIELGLPCEVIDRVYYANTDNIDEFFRRLTLRRQKGFQPDAE
jgi:hypothetical protein